MNHLLRSVSLRLSGLFRHSLFQQLTVYGIGASSAQLMMMIYAIVVARSLGPESYGLFAGNYALAGLTIFLVNWGMDTWMLRESGSHPDPRVLSSTVLQTKFLLGLLWLLLLTVFAPLIQPVLFPRPMLLIAAIDVLGDSFLITFISGLNIQKRTQPATQLLLFTRGSRLAGAVLLILVGVQQPVVFAGLRWLATAAGLGLAWFLVRPLWLPGGVLRSAATLRASIAYGVPELLALVYAQVDVTILGLLQGKVAVGNYAPAVSLINALTVVPNSIFFIVVPLLSKKYQSAVGGFRRAAGQIAVIYAVVGLGMAVGTALVVKPLLAFLLGDQFLLAGSLVLVMSPIVFLKSISFACATYLVVVSWQSKRIGVQLVSALANIGLNLAFIPVYGPWGAAYIYVFSELILMAGYTGLVFYHMRSSGKEEVTAGY